jgi:hypothetical protein
MMKLKPRLSFPAIAAICIAQLADAGTLEWAGSTTGLESGSSDTWDTNTTANWWDGASLVNWPAPGGTDDDAVFGGTAGAVTIAAGGVTARDVTFNASGYTLTGGTLHRKHHDTLNGILRCPPSPPAPASMPRSPQLHRRHRRADQGGRWNPFAPCWLRHPHWRNRRQRWHFDHRTTPARSTGSLGVTGTTPPRAGSPSPVTAACGSMAARQLSVAVAIPTTTRC